MNYGNSPILLRHLMAIKGEIREARKQWLGGLSDAQLANVIGPRFEEYFETLDAAIQYRMAYDKALCGEIVEAYREWIEEPH